MGNERQSEAEIRESESLVRRKHYQQLITHLKKQHNGEGKGTKSKRRKKAENKSD